MRADVPCRGRIYRQSHNIFFSTFSTPCAVIRVPSRLIKSASSFCFFVFNTFLHICKQFVFHLNRHKYFPCSSPPLRVTTNDEVSKHTSRISRLISSLTRQPVPRYAVKSAISRFFSVLVFRKVTTCIIFFHRYISRQEG